MYNYLEINVKVCYLRAEISNTSHDTQEDVARVRNTLADRFVSSYRGFLELN